LVEGGLQVAGHAAGRLRGRACGFGRAAAADPCGDARPVELLRRAPHRAYLECDQPRRAAGRDRVSERMAHDRSGVRRGRVRGRGRQSCRGGSPSERSPWVSP
jgi:hypothetical protein